MSGLFISKLFQNPEFYLITVVVVIFSICVHEASHTVTARFCGDRTAWDNGYMTLNPLKLMGIPSLLMLAICGIAWGMVPVNPERLRPQWRRGLVAFAGPAANLVLALGFSLVLILYSLLVRLLPPGAINAEFSHYALMLLISGVLMNVVLAMFNLLPVPPLDGWDVFATIFPPLQKVNAELRNAAVVVIFFLMLSPVGFRFLYAPAYAVLSLVCKLAGLETGK